jgi:hypothetical protein
MRYYADSGQDWLEFQAILNSKPVDSFDTNRPLAWIPSQLHARALWYCAVVEF